MRHPPCVLTVAGTDPSGGAGIQADIKAISATGSYAASVITALVAQNTQGVQAIQEVPTAFIAQQLDAVFQDLHIKAVKIGMLHDHEVMHVVAQSLQTHHPEYVILDPVMVAKNGCALLKEEAVSYLKEQLIPAATLITPNISEAEKILDMCIESSADMIHAARSIAEEYQVNVLLKGGHLNAPEASDVLWVTADNTSHWFHAPRIHTKNTHGTGCSLSAAIASFLAQGKDLLTAVQLAKKYLFHAIVAGSNQQIGKGHGPVDHFYFLDETLIL
ncbi:bifunctional hydroxymethylpyrimidine kinase/phosphomethylpyrimidine kinase [Legionella septentrionalis]|uniref:bifunctional hydroxymethylpyrimidine kinase/phosphomethylpyrimidine kinase n=1 Tax=Legionella septentrionalis TaxID=2498109 RepID=UPI000F8F27E4|nr:bifunctional hydroxymethylpyrimidine kinase/phosphomethylpyrimidine kinase [Legionella septentrionalis]RUR02359.1 bifunctional hydroxymethylpyrimidine kinase/phosphomethylpyrimidine kinase [Legionella septentrionalis]RUR10302.1 bifunctional hydroxymethylpyrimidine kinase/phosphomethylpyrimidine kinase [Legionella septentrionalis]